MAQSRGFSSTPSKAQKNFASMKFIGYGSIPALIFGPCPTFLTWAVTGADTCLICPGTATRRPLPRPTRTTRRTL
eukprot:scaffold224055_cov17-Prasinocladus_malaysianus.AAC.1